MNILLILFGFTAVLLIVIFWFARREAQIHGTTVREEVIGICTFALDQTVQKENKKAAILALFEEAEELSNTDIREMTGFSRASVVRYMNDLEEERKVMQIGDVGRGVAYRLLGK